MNYYKITASVSGYTHDYYMSYSVATIKEAEQKFASKFTWMKIIDVIEISKDEYKAYIAKVQSHIRSTDEFIRKELSENE